MLKDKWSEKNPNQNKQNPLTTYLQTKQNQTSTFKALASFLNTNEWFLLFSSQRYWQAAYLHLAAPKHFKQMNGILKTLTLSDFYMACCSLIKKSSKIKVSSDSSDLIMILYLGTYFLQQQMWDLCWKSNDQMLIGTSVNWANRMLMPCERVINITTNQYFSMKRTHIITAVLHCKEGLEGGYPGRH